ncbi:MAG: hypothetical protein JJ900_16795 [Rhodospirillales bacterium]|nr:hypothetical protein [Rhodospirillales bacterium]MBO6788508.1 hypothetical protein [Rhodospirillales bacterium]
MAIFAFVWFEVIPACLLLAFKPVVLKWVLFDCMAVGAPKGRTYRRR